MVHGGLPGTSWLGCLSVKQKERGETETPLPVGRSFRGNCHLRDDSVCDCVQPVQVTLRGGCGVLRCGRARWFGLGVVVGGRVVETGRTLNCLTYWEIPVTRSLTDWTELTRTGGATGAHISAKSTKSRVCSIFFFFYSKDCLKGTFHVIQRHLRSYIGQKHQPRLILAVVLYFWAILKVFQVTS